MTWCLLQWSTRSRVHRDGRAVLSPLLQPHHRELSTAIWAGCATDTLGMVLGEEPLQPAAISLQSLCKGLSSSAGTRHGVSLWVSMETHH